MKLHVLGSGSSGNCYILEGKTESLVLECGIPAKTVLEKIGFKADTIAGCLVSHEHGDHSKYIDRFQSYGVPVFGGGGHKFKDMEKIKVGGFTVRAVRAVHDVETFLFLVQHPECGVVAYITDTHYVPNKLAGVNHWLIEANYDVKILEANIQAGRLPVVVRERVLHSHMSIETTIDCLKSNDLSPALSVFLLHLSNGNSDEVRFKQQVVEQTGLPTYIAKAGMTVKIHAPGSHF